MAKDFFQISVNGKDARIGLKRFREHTEGVVKSELLDTAFEIMRLSQKEVPHDEGTLANSGVVEPDGEDIIIGYHTPYAARLHEHPEYNFQKGRKGRYLEDPIVENEEVLGLKLGKNIKKRIK